MRDFVDDKFLHDEEQPDEAKPKEELLDGDALSTVTCE